MPLGKRKDEIARKRGLVCQSPLAQQEGGMVAGVGVQLDAECWAPVDLPRPVQLPTLSSHLQSPCTQGQGCQLCAGASSQPPHHGLASLAPSCSLSSCVCLPMADESHQLGPCCPLIPRVPSGLPLASVYHHFPCTSEAPSQTPGAVGSGC